MNKSLKSPFKTLSIWTPFTRAEIFIASLLVNLLSLALPLALLQVYDRVIPNKSYGTITLLVVGVGAAIFLDACLRFARNYIMGLVGARYEHQAGVSALKHMLSTDVGDFEKDGSGIHVERFNALMSLREYYSGQALIVLIDLPFVLLFLALIFYFGGELGILLLLLIAVFGLCAIFFGQRLASSLQDLRENDDTRYDTLIGDLRGISTIKTQAMEPRIQRKYEMVSQKSAELGQKNNFRTGSIADLGFVTSQIAIISVIGYGGLLVANGNLSLGGLAASTMLAGRTMQPLGNLLGFWTKLQSFRNARKRIDELFDIPLGLHIISNKKQTFSQNISPPQVRGAIKIDNLSFRFANSDEDLLTDINLDIAAGDFIALTGPNGSGKSVLLTLIRGLLTPSRGKVFIDDKPIEEWDGETIDHTFSYLPQNETLFNGSILQNITTFRTEKESQALAAANLVGLTDWIHLLPNGFRTLVGEETGKRLPRGIGQRVALARSLVNDSKIILFDDANSAVDQLGDAAVKSVLTKLKGYSTVVVVSHRPSILKLADRIYYVGNKQVHEETPVKQAPGTEDSSNG